MQTFVGEGAPMRALLAKVHLKDRRTKGYAGKLLAAFGPGEDERATSAGMRPDQSMMVEPLSDRELEVLELIARGMTNREIATHPEIASRLYLSINTVKVHTRNIYGKLAVNNRTQAVAEARSLGFLSST